VVFGAGKVLDFTYVDDCVAGVMSGLERLVNGRVRDQTINLACGVGHRSDDCIPARGVV
jgi:UDP-glucose 4-epimerase